MDKRLDIWDVLQFGLLRGYTDFVRRETVLVVHGQPLSQGRVNRDNFLAVHFHRPSDGPGLAGLEADEAVGAGDLHQVFVANQHAAGIDRSEVLGAVGRQFCAHLDVPAELVRGVDFPGGIHDDRDVVGLSDADHFLYGQRSRLVARSQVVDPRRARPYCGLDVLRTGLLGVAYLHQFAARNGDAPVVLDSKVPLDDELVRHARSVGQLVDLLLIVARHARRCSHGQGRRASRGHQGCLSANHLGNLQAHCIHKVAHVNVVFFGLVHHGADGGGGSGSPQQRPVPHGVEHRAHAEFFKNASHRKLLSLSPDLS